MRIPHIFRWTRFMEHIIEKSRIREILGTPNALTRQKIKGNLHQGMMRFIKASPLVMLATVDEMGENIRGLMYQIIAKHRDGKLGKHKFNAKLSCSQLKEWNTNTSINFNSQSILDSPF